MTPAPERAELGPGARNGDNTSSMRRRSITAALLSGLLVAANLAACAKATRAKEGGAQADAGKTLSPVGALARADGGGRANTKQIDAAVSGCDAGLPAPVQIESGVARSCSALPPPACPASPNSPQPFAVLLDAADFGVGAHITAADLDDALVVGGNAAWRVVHLLKHGGPYETLAAPAGDLQPLDLVAGYLPPDPDTLAVVASSVFVLACTADGQRCVILRGTYGDASFSEWPGRQLPSDFVPRGLFMDQAVSPPLLCVYGNGLLCFDGGWKAAIPVEQGLQLNDFSFGGTLSLAVGGHGRYFTRWLDACGTSRPWQEQTPLGDFELRAAGATGTPALMLGSGNRLLMLTTTDKPRLTVCLADEELAAVWAEPDDLVPSNFLTQSGRLYRGAAPDGLCETQITAPGTFLGGWAMPCGLQEKLQVWTSQQVLVRDNCFHD